MDRYMRSAPFNMIHVCIDTYDHYSITGRCYNNTIKNVITFKDINYLFIEVDKIFDANGNPMSSQVKRSFNKNEPGQGTYKHRPPMVVSYEEFLKESGDVDTFDVVVKSRRASSWQGYVFHAGKSYKFDEILEMMKIVYELLNM